MSELQMKIKHPAAHARLTGSKDAAGLTGVVKFYQQPGGIIVEVRVHGLPENQAGMYGFHIHEGNACSGTDFSATGGHFNPKYLPHPRHAGDLPSLLSCNGKAYMQVLTDRFSIRDILGRTVVIHGMPDDFRSQPSGDSGKKIACGVIVKSANRVAHS